MQETNVLARIRKRLGPVVIIYLPSKSKKPTFSWKGLTYEKTLQPDYVRSLENAAEHGNLAILLGPPSGNLVTIDCDDSGMLETMLRKFTILWKTLITYGARGAQIWFRMAEGDYEPQCRKWLVNEEYSIEFRGGGGYSLISGIHPKGMPYRQEWGDGILTLTSKQLNEIKRWVNPNVDDEVEPDEVDLSWTRDFPNIDLNELDIVRLLRAAELNPTKTERGKDGETIYDINCPWRKNHHSATKKEDAGILLNKNQWPNFKCHHKSCEGKGIGDVLHWVEDNYPGLIEDYSSKPEIPEQPKLSEYKSYAHYFELELDPNETILGKDRWLCRGSAVLIIAPSGVGKSVIAAQAAILWSLGLTAFDIQPTRSLKIMTFQNEDNEGDLIEMSRVIKHLELVSSLEEIRKNTAVVELTQRGKAFVDIVRMHLEVYKPDLVIINPYTGFCAPLRDEDLTNVFLRDQLSPALKDFNCGCLVIHHMPKPGSKVSKDDDESDEVLIESSYKAAGFATMTNWARGTLTISPVPKMQGVYKFMAGKRGKRIGWGRRVKYFCHSDVPGQLLWTQQPYEKITEEAIQMGEIYKNQEHDPMELLKYIKKTGSIVADIAMASGLAYNTVKGMLENKLLPNHKVRKCGKLWKLV